MALVGLVFVAGCPDDGGDSGYAQTDDAPDPAGPHQATASETDPAGTERGELGLDEEPLGS